ncbi:hypothetical protein EMIT093MI4_70231 [Pseudomonas sp. IT-93MI4]
MFFCIIAHKASLLDFARPFTNRISKI